MKASLSFHLTLILISDRINEVIPSIKYYLNFKCHIIFPCASEEIFNKISKYWKSTQLITILRPPATGNDLISRLRTAEQFINTPYIAIVSGDDMLLKSGANNAIKFLTKNKEYSSYFGLTAQMAFSSTGIPLLFPMYRTQRKKLSTSNNLEKSLSKYREYALIYGISKKEVLTLFLDFLESVDIKWAGVFELAYGLAVSFNGPSMYARNKSFLLRLVHQPSRSSHVDYPISPSIDETVLSYTSKYLNLSTLSKLLNDDESNMSYSRMVNYLYTDISSESLHYNDYPIPNLIEVSDLKLYLSMSRRAIQTFFIDQSLLMSLPGLYLHACQYKNIREKYNINLRISRNFWRY